MQSLVSMPLSVKEFPRKETMLSAAAVHDKNRVELSKLYMRNSVAVLLLAATSGYIDRCQQYC